MDSYIFNIVLITLVVVIILHLTYNNSLFSSHHNKNVSKEPMTNMSISPSCVTDKNLKLYDDGVYREPGTYGLDRTADPKNWYHVANKLVTEDEIVDFYVDTDKSDIDKAIRSLKKHKKNNKYNKHCKYNKQDKKNKDKRCCKNRLFFGDNYDGKIKSESFDEILAKT